MQRRYRCRHRAANRLLGILLGVCALSILPLWAQIQSAKPAKSASTGKRSAATNANRDAVLIGNDLVGSRHLHKRQCRKQTHDRGTTEKAISSRHVPPQDWLSLWTSRQGGQVNWMDDGQPGS